MPISREALLEAIKQIGDRKIGEGISIVSQHPGSDKPSGAILETSNPYGTEETRISEDGTVTKKIFK